MLKKNCEHSYLSHVIITRYVHKINRVILSDSIKPFNCNNIILEVPTLQFYDMKYRTSQNNEYQDHSIGLHPFRYDL